MLKINVPIQENVLKLVADQMPSFKMTKEDGPNVE